MWVLSKEDTRMPSWLSNIIGHNCEYCGSDMENYYNTDFRCTNRRCTDSNCIGFQTYRADYALKLLEVKGVGPSWCQLELSKTPGKSHLRVLKGLDIPPIPLGLYLKMCCIPGVDNQWITLCETNNYYSVDDLYTKYDGELKPILLEYEDLIRDGLNYVKLQQPKPGYYNKPPKESYTIMITGTPLEFASKDDFINRLNTALNGVIKIIHQKTPKQSGVDFLIREPGSTTRGKVSVATKAGIPIVTSKEFLAFLQTRVDAIVQNNSN